MEALLVHPMLTSGADPGSGGTEQGVQADRAFVLAAALVGDALVVRRHAGVAGGAMNEIFSLADTADPAVLAVVNLGLVRPQVADPAVVLAKDLPALLALVAARLLVLALLAFDSFYLEAVKALVA